MTCGTLEPPLVIDLDAHKEDGVFVFNFHSDDPQAYALIMVNGEIRASINGNRIIEVNHG